MAVVGYACAWLALSVAAALCLGRVLSLRSSRAPRMVPLEARQVQQVLVHRSVVLSTAGIPTITVG